MRRSAISLLILIARPALAQPTTDVVGCSFDSASLAAAIALEDQAAGRPSTGTIHVTCSADGTALVRAETQERTVDLADLPPSLAPRVIALVAVTLLHEPPPVLPPPPPPPTADDRPPSPPPVAPEPGSEPEPESESEPESEPLASRPSLLTTPLSRTFSQPLSMSARALVRVHDSTSALFGVALSVTSGAASFGLSAAGTRIEHSLGTLTPYLLAAHGNLALACTGATCVALDGEVGRISVLATASDPMSVSARTLSALYAHAALELSLSGRIADLDVSAVAALGTSRGVIARVDTEAAAVLAGWTLGAALEVRR